MSVFVATDLSSSAYTAASFTDEVHESVTSSPEGNHVTVTMEQVSTGGTRHAAEFKRRSSGAMSDAERRKKARVRASLFPEKRAEALRTDAERKHASRVNDAIDAERDTEPDAESDAESDATSDCNEADRLQDKIISSFDSGVQDEAAVKQLQVLRARQFAPKCDCSVLTEWGICKKPTCFD